MTERLEQLADLVCEHSGIVLHGPHRINSLSAALAKLDPPVDAAGALRAAGDPTSGDAFVAGLLEAVAVHETFFFRQREDLDAIDWHSLLASARADRAEGVRVWVAGCSTGEEAWTLAILASEALGASPPVAVLATDLSAAALRSAERGRYRGRSVRLVEAPLRERHFDPDGTQLLVSEPLRRLVTFRQQNLVTDPLPAGRFDLVLCRNVLIYFDPPTVERVVDRLEGALASGGMLLLGAADRLCRLPSSSRTAAGARRRPAQPAPARQPASTSPAATTAPRRWRTVRRDDEPVSAVAAIAEGAMAIALAAADAGRLDDAIAATERVLAADPLDADAHFMGGIAHLGRGDARTAAASLRRALYVDPSFALAAFQLGRAYDALDDGPAARRAYLQALRTLAPGHDRQQRLVADIDLADVAAACGARLAALSPRSSGPR
jgi:chemotaxis protein methyltransferase CheR